MGIVRTAPKKRSSGRRQSFRGDQLLCAGAHACKVARFCCHSVKQRWRRFLDQTPRLSGDATLQGISHQRAELSVGTWTVNVARKKSTETRSSYPL